MGCPSCPGEDAAAAAAPPRVQEETGWRPRLLKRLESYQPMPGLVDTPPEALLAHGGE